MSSLLQLGEAAQTSPDPNKIELLRQLGGQDTYRSIVVSGGSA